MPRPSVKPVKLTGAGSRAHRKSVRRRQEKLHTQIQTICHIFNPWDGTFQYFDPITRQLQTLAEESIGSIDTPIVSRQPDVDPESCGPDAIEDSQRGETLTLHNSKRPIPSSITPSVLSSRNNSVLAEEGQTEAERQVCRELAVESLPEYC